jgi:hypothetical protein
VTVEADLIRCDGRGCQVEATVDIPASSLEIHPEFPYEVRRWFALLGWKSVEGQGGSDGLLDLCPLHTRSDWAAIPASPGSKRCLLTKPLQ